MYSNSRIETFEKCPRKYKFRYLENIKSETEGVEAYVGKRVHETLEKLYRDLKMTKMNTLEDLLRFYESEWEKNWHGKIQVVRKARLPPRLPCARQGAFRDQRSPPQFWGDPTRATKASSASSP